MSPASVTIEVRYERGHTLRETWEPTEYHCPSCGVQRVWVDSGPGDYYEGPWHLCAECGSAFTMPRLCTPPGWQDEQRLEAIRTTTRLGDT